MSKLRKIGLSTIGVGVAVPLLVIATAHAAPPPFQAIVDAVNAASAAITASISASTAAIVGAIKAGSGSCSGSCGGGWPPDPTDLVDLDSRQNLLEDLAGNPFNPTPPRWPGPCQLDPNKWLGRDLQCA